MKVRLRLVGVTVADPDPRVRGEWTLGSESTVADLIAASDPDQPDHMAVFVNGNQVEEAEWSTTSLSEGDEVVLIRPLEGGCPEPSGWVKALG